MKLYGWLDDQYDPEGRLVLFEAGDMTDALTKVAKEYTRRPPFDRLPEIRVYETRLPPRVTS